MRAASARASRRIRPAQWLLVSAGSALVALAPALPAGGATDPRLPASGVSTAAGSWVTLPMGQLSNESNTFWELFHAAPGSPRWSLVTPEGTADNGGLVAGVSAGSIVAGVLPSALLRFSPLSLSTDGGGTWSPVFLPGGLADVSDALAVEAVDPGGALAVVGVGRVLAAPGDLTSWAPLISTSGLRKVAPACGVQAIDAVAFAANRAPLVASRCGKGGRVGVFTLIAGSWRAVGPILSGRLRGQPTAVLRLETAGSTTAVLFTVGGAGHRALLAAWAGSRSSWTLSAPLTLTSGASVRASAVGADGRVAVLVGLPRSRAAVDEVGPGGGAWTPLPGPPPGATGLALPEEPPRVDAPPVDVFSVDASVLHVFELTPSRSRWSKIQTTRIPISYGSSG